MRWVTSRPWATKARNFSGAFLGSLLTAARMTAPETALAVRNSPGGTGGASGGARLLPLKKAAGGCAIHFSVASSAALIAGAGASPAARRAETQAHQTASRLGRAWATKGTASGKRALSGSSAPKSLGGGSGRASAMASSPSSATAARGSVFELGCAAEVPILVNRDQAALHLHHGASIEGDHQTLNGNACLIDRDAVLAHRKCDGLHGSGLDCAPLDVRNLIAGIERDLLIATFDEEGVVIHDSCNAVAIDIRTLVPRIKVQDRTAPARYVVTSPKYPGDLDAILDRNELVVADRVLFVVLDQGSGILFGLHVDEFAARGVVKGHLVVVIGGASGRAAGLGAADVLPVRQRPRRHCVRIIDVADDDGLVHVAIHEIHHHLLADAGKVDAAKLSAGPFDSDAHPAGAVGIGLAFAIPVELDFEAAVFIGEDFLAGRPHHHGGLHAPDAGRRRDAWRAERQGDGDAGEGIGIFEGRGGVVGVVVDSEGLLGQVLHAGEHELAVVGKVAGQLEGVARGESAVLAFGSNEHAGGRLFLHADVGDALVLVEEVTRVGGLIAPGLGDGIEARGVAARVFVDFELVVAGDVQLMADAAGADGFDDGLGGIQVLFGELEVMAPGGEFAGADFLLLAPVGDAILLENDVRAVLPGGGGKIGHGGMGQRAVGEHELVAAGGMLEEIKDAFFLHEAADKREIGFVVLDAILAGLQGLLDLIGHVQAGKDLPEDVGDGDLLEGPAILFAAKEPQFGDDLQHIVSELIVAKTLRDPADHAVDIALIGAVSHFDGDLLAK